MEKTQADAIAQAIRGPDPRTQELIRHTRAAEIADLSRKRRVAWFMLAGSAVGAGVAYLNGMRFSLGVIWGGLAGSAIGWLVTLRRAA